MSKEDASKAACEAVRALAVQVEIPQRLTDLGIKESDIPALAAQAIADVCTPAIRAKSPSTTSRSFTGKCSDPHF